MRAGRWSGERGDHGAKLVAHGQLAVDVSFRRVVDTAGVWTACWLRRHDDNV
jgi:hypothetical protein